MKKEDIRDNFIEFNEYKEFCEYKDCMHINEKKCAIKENVENNIKISLSRAYGVGEVNVMGAATSMRVWIDADKATALNIPIDTIKSAIRSQNVQPALGSIGSAPGDGNQMLVYSLETKGRLNEPKDFENIIIRTVEEGGLVKLKDIAKVELGSENYLISSTVDGKPAVSIIINKSSGANAVNAMKAVKAELKKFIDDLFGSLNTKLVTSKKIYAKLQLTNKELYKKLNILPNSI